MHRAPNPLPVPVTEPPRRPRPAPQTWRFRDWASI